jgi:hypothetical protein
MIELHIWINCIDTQHISQSMQDKDRFSSAQPFKCLAKGMGISKETMRSSVKLLKLQLYRITGMYHLQPHDNDLCNWYLKSYHDGKLDPTLSVRRNLVEWTCEHKMQHRSSHLLHEVQFRDVKGGVWYTLSVRKIVGPVFHWDNIKSER